MKIIRVPLPTPTLYPHTTTNSYLIGDEHETLLVDAGYNQEETRIELEKALEENQLARPKAVLLTHSHRDHVPGVCQLNDWNLLVYCHEKDRAEIEASINPGQTISLLNDRDQLQIAGRNITVIHGPGHTPGQLNLYLASEQLLISGDNIIAEGTTWIGAPDGNMSDYLKTLKLLQTLKLTKIGPGHGDWITNPYEQIEFVIQRRLLREQQILNLLQKHGSLSVKQLTERIYENSIHPSIFGVAKKTIEAHLEKLRKEGSVSCKDSVYMIITSNS